MTKTWENVSLQEAQDFVTWAKENHDEVVVKIDTPLIQSGVVSGHKFGIEWQFLYTFDKIKDTIEITAANHQDSIFQAITNKLGSAKG